MNGEVTQSGKPEHARRDESRAELPGRLIHGRLPQPIAELGSFANSIPAANLLTLVVELEVVDDGFGVESEEGPDDGRIVVRDEPVSVRRGDIAQRRQRFPIDRPVVIWKARGSPCVEERELWLGFAGTCNGGLSERYPGPAVCEGGGIEIDFRGNSQDVPKLSRRALERRGKDAKRAADVEVPVIFARKESFRKRHEVRRPIIARKNPKWLRVVRGWSEPSEGRDRFPNGHDVLWRVASRPTTLPKRCSGVKLRGSCPSTHPRSRSLELDFMASTTSTPSTSLALAQRAAQIAIDNKGQDVTLLDLRGVTDMTDFFLIVSGTSDTHVRSLGEHIMLALKKEGSPAHHVEGLEKGRWVLLDFVDFVVHVFHPTLRNFYQLERLWADAEEVPLERGAGMGA